MCCKKIALVWSASRRAQTQHQNLWHDISCHQTRNKLINIRVLTTKPQARMPVQPHPLTHLPIHKQKQVTIWYGHTAARTGEIRVLRSFIDVENTFSFSHPLPCLLSPLWAHWSFQEYWGFSLCLSLPFLDAWLCFLSVPLAIRYSSISFQAWSSCATQINLLAALPICVASFSWLFCWL